MVRAVLVSFEPDVLDLVEELPALQIVGCLDQADRTFPDTKNLGRDDQWQLLLRADPELKAILAIDPPNLRSRLATHYGLENILSLTSPRSFVSTKATIGRACIIQRLASVGRYATLGTAVKLNCGAQVHHDCRIGDYSTVAPGARLLGHAIVGARCYIGSEAVILPRVTIGDDAVVGAGSVVTRDVPNGVVVRGEPAR